MPELPEVETVRRGLVQRVQGRTLTTADIEHPRTSRRQPGGPEEFRERVAGRTVTAVGRRGKYLWLELDGGPEVVAAHLGMSGQFRVVDGVEPDPHRRAQWRLDDGRTLVYRDQRTFGWLLADELVDDVPHAAAHIARDPFDPAYDPGAAAGALRRSSAGVKRVLLAQTVVSGVGNIYADEALWRVRLHPETPARRLSAARARDLLGAATDVMTEALAAGGTSFDPLYVSVNGDSGWFDRSLAVYGREGEPCDRCGAPIVREQFTNRSSHRCPRCQRRPRNSR